MMRFSRTSKKQPEAIIQDSILAWLMWQPDLVIFPQKKVAVCRDGVYFKAKGNQRGRSTVWRVGVPDILVWSKKHSLLIGLEVKTKRGRPTSEQMQCLDDLSQQQAISAIVRSVEDVQDLFRKITCPI